MVLELAAAEAKGEASLVFIATDCHAMREEDRRSGKRPCTELIYILHVSEQRGKKRRGMTNNVIVFLPFILDRRPLRRGREKLGVC